MRRGVGRMLWAGLLLGGVLMLSACHFSVGCHVVRIFEPTPTTGLHLDNSACVTSPPAVVPEAPFAVLLPVVGLGAGGVVLVRRRRRSNS